MKKSKYPDSKTQKAVINYQGTLLYDEINEILAYS